MTRTLSLALASLFLDAASPLLAQDGRSLDLTAGGIGLSVGDSRGVAGLRGVGFGGLGTGGRARGVTIGGLGVGVGESATGLLGAGWGWWWVGTCGASQWPVGGSEWAARPAASPSPGWGSGRGRG